MFIGNIWPYNFQHFEGVLTQSVDPKHVIPCIVQKRKRLIRLINDITSVVDNQIWGLILLYILKVLENVCASRGNRVTDALLPGLNPFQANLSINGRKGLLSPSK